MNLLVGDKATQPPLSGLMELPRKSGLALLFMALFLFLARCLGHYQGFSIGTLDDLAFLMHCVVWQRRWVRFDYGHGWELDSGSIL